MDEEQLKALMSWVDSRIDVRIEQAFGRDALIDSIQEEQFKSELFKSFGLGS